MNLVIRRVAVYSLLGTAAVFARDAVSADTLIRGVERHYNAAKTLSVSFTETYAAGGRRHHPESGQLLLRKPGQMRWAYNDPAGKLFISDGKQVHLYTADDNRVEVSKLKASDDLRAPMAFLLGKLDLKKEFRSFEINPAENGTSILVAEAKSERLPYERVRMLIGSGYTIQQLTVDGRDGSTLQFAFRDEKVNLPAPAEVFHFTPPPGADVVDAVALAKEDK